MLFPRLALCVVVPFLLHCGDDTTPNDAAVTDSRLTDGAEPDAPDDADASIAAPLVSDVFADCAAPGRAGGLASGTDLARVDVDTTVYPHALCGDGTGAIFFVRPASEPTDADRWLITLQGGGSCSSPETCAQRWCGMDGNFGGNKLSTRYAPAQGMRAKGLSEDIPDNPFGSWNQVFIYYCSSDSWTGAQDLIEVEAPHPILGGSALPFTIQFHGSQIIEAVVDSLQTGVTSMLGTMPDLDDASDVVFAGASAGGSGIVNNLDRLRADLLTTNPDLEMHGLIDSAYTPRMAELDFGPTHFCTDAGVCTYDSYMQAFWQIKKDFWNVQAEESCESWHTANMTGLAHYCADNRYLIENHVTTPFVLRMGLRDMLLVQRFVDLGFNVPDMGGGPMTEESFARMVSSQLLEFDGLQTTANEGADITRAPGIFGPPCTKHDTLRSSPDIYDVWIDVMGVQVSFPDLIRRWRSGQPAVAVVRDPADSFHCP